MIRLIASMILFSFFGLILQGVVLHSVLPAYLIPNFLLIAVVFLGFHEVSVFGVVLAFVCGLMFDLFSGVLIGPWSGSFVFVYALLALFAQRLFTRSRFTVMLSVFLANVIATALYFALLYQFQSIEGRLFSISLVESLSSSLAAPLVFSLLGRLTACNPQKRSSRSSMTEVFSLARSER